jgi:hypothetical protein
MKRVTAAAPRSLVGAPKRQKQTPPTLAACMEDLRLAFAVLNATYDSKDWLWQASHKRFMHRPTKQTFPNAQEAAEYFAVDATERDRSELRNGIRYYNDDEWDICKEKDGTTRITFERNDFDQPYMFSSTKIAINAMKHYAKVSDDMYALGYLDCKSTVDRATSSLVQHACKLWAEVNVKGNTAKGYIAKGYIAKGYTANANRISDQNSDDHDFIDDDDENGSDEDSSCSESDTGDDNFDDDDDDHDNDDELTRAAEGDTDSSDSDEGACVDDNSDHASTSTCAPLHSHKPLGLAPAPMGGLRTLQRLELVKGMNGIGADQVQQQQGVNGSIQRVLAMLAIPNVACISLLHDDDSTIAHNTRTKLCDAFWIMVALDAAMRDLEDAIASPKMAFYFVCREQKDDVLAMMRKCKDIPWCAQEIQRRFVNGFAVETDSIIEKLSADVFQCYLGCKENRAAPGDLRLGGESKLMLDEYGCPVESLSDELEADNLDLKRGAIEDAAAAKADPTDGGFIADDTVTLKDARVLVGLWGHLCDHAFQYRLPAPNTRIYDMLAEGHTLKAVTDELAKPGDWWPGEIKRAVRNYRIDPHHHVVPALMPKPRRIMLIEPIDEHDL